MFLPFFSSLRSLTSKDIYLNLVLPILLVVALFFHKFAAVFIIFITFGLYLLKESPIKKTIFSVLRLMPVQLLILFWIWSGVTLLWSINFENGIFIWFKFCGMLVLGMVNFSSINSISNKIINNIFFILSLTIIGVIISYLVMWPLEYEFEKPLAYFLALFFFPVATFLGLYLPHKLKFLIFVLFAFTAYSLKISGAQSGLIGFLLGAIIFSITLAHPYRTTNFLKILTFFWTLLTPLFMLVFSYHYELLPYARNIGTSLYHRFCIWNFVTHKIFEKFLLGWGLGSSKKFPQSDELVFENINPEQYSFFDTVDVEIIYWTKTFLNNMPLHPHNNALQVYLELGLVGGVIYSLFLASIFQLFLKAFKDKVVLATANAMAVLTLVIFNMSHSIWHMWLLAWIILSFAMLYALSIYRARKFEGENHEN